ncbi:hypothetical protein BHE74_00008917, partial [Ensete ventricosum]
FEKPKGFKKMPRTSAVECPGCAPLRALTTDVLGLVKALTPVFDIPRKGIELNMWDLGNCSKTWTAKSVRLYDTSAKRRPVISVDFRESPIKAVCEDLDGYTVYVGNGSGDLASFDMRTGKSHNSTCTPCAMH